MHIEEISLRSDGGRLEQALRERYVWVSRSSWQDLFDQGLIKTKTGKSLKPGLRLEGSLDLLIHWPDWPLGLIAQGQDLRVYLQTSDVLIAEKKSGEPSYPLRAWERDTFANRVAAHLAPQMDWRDFQSLGDRPVLEGGLCQRLDVDTSGLLCIALNARAKSLLRKEFSGQFEKTYLALVEGEFPQKKTSLHGFVSSKTENKMEWSETGLAQEGAEVAIRFLSIGKGPKVVSLVEVKTTHGQRHIVRSGLAYLGYPLLGDVQYGALYGVSAHLLHASQLQYTGKQIFAGSEELTRGISCPLPANFLNMMKVFCVS